MKRTRPAPGVGSTRACADALALRGWPGLAAMLALLAACSGAKVVQGFPDSFVGVGLELHLEGSHPVVVRTLPGGSAAEAGVEPGDRVLLIDGVATDGMSLGDVVMRLRGKPDTQVTMSMDRAGQRIIVVVRRRAMAKKDQGYEAKR